MDMADQSTCGEGLAENSRVPAKFGELTAAMAENLEVHLQSLDLTDENARREHDAYQDLAKQYREIAARLRATGAEMASYRDLPMGRHDPQAMASPEVVAAFEKFVKLEHELLELVQDRVNQDQHMLSEMPH
jgi:hypothetical protein